MNTHSPRLLLCSDLDRTLLPNGEAPESPEARAWLRRLADRPEVTLAYVSGRGLNLLRAAVEEFDIPLPDYAAGDVGSSLYRVENGIWREELAWQQAIAPDWNGLTHAVLAELLHDLPELRLQEPQHQNTYKLSFYTPAELDRDRLLAEVEERLSRRGVRAGLIWSLDDLTGVGLLDVLPASATKLHAVRFLMEKLGFGHQETVFAGDSGNDLPALTSGLQAVLVKNAREEVREEALNLARANGCERCLYLARGGFLGLNGCYSAGVLEGAAHFAPAVTQWLKE